MKSGSEGLSLFTPCVLSGPCVCRQSPGREDGPYLPVFMLVELVLLLFLEELLVELVLSFLVLFLAPRLFMLFFALRFSMVCDLLSESEEGAGAFARRVFVRRASSLLV